jgi:hypothetical protein
VATVFRVHGRATIAVADTNPAALAVLRSQLDPYPPCTGSGDDALVTLERATPGDLPPFEDIQNRAGDDVVTAAADGRCYLLFGDAWCTLPQVLEEPRFVYREGVPLARLFRLLVRPALQVAMLARDSVAVHATAVDLGGSALLVGGWSESGKTETALPFLENGARFLSDKWTIVSSDGVAGVFPVSVGVRRWVLTYAPRLRHSLPVSARIQLLGAGVASGLVRPFERRQPTGRVAGVVFEAARHAVDLAERASLRPSQLRSAYGQATNGGWTARIGALALLTTVPRGQGVTVTEGDADWAARKLARAAAFERRPFFDLYDRARYAFPELVNPRAESELADERFLAHVLSRIRILDVRAPFPTDPRTVAESIRRALERA